MSRSDLIKDLQAGDLRFFVCTAPKNEIKKTGWISKKEENILTIHNVKLKEMVEGLNPTFILKSNDRLFQFNYLYSYDHKRFYWMDEPPVLLPQGQMEIRCKIDPLYSWIREIGDCMVFEDRSSNIGTGYIQDDEIIFNASPQGKIFEFTNSPGSKVFKDQSYILTVSNRLAYASKFSEGDEPQNDLFTKDYAYPQYTDGDHAIIQAIFDQIDIWRTAGWEYSQDDRNSNGYVDCSSLIRRAFISALNLESDFFNTSTGYNTAAAIAYWFQENPDYAYSWQMGRVGQSILSNDSCLEWHCAYDLRPGDLIFFFSNTHKDRFPSCWEANSVFPDGSSYFDNEYFCRDIFGASAGKIDDHKVYGFGHIAIVHDCLIDKFNTFHSLKGYKASLGKLVVDGNATAKTPTKNEGGLWLLEALPQKARNLTTFYNGTVDNIDCGANNLTAGGILYNRRNSSKEVQTSIGKNGELEGIQSVKKFVWSDNTIAMYIRPNYTKIVEDFQLGE